MYARMAPRSLAQAFLNEPTNIFPSSFHKRPGASIEALRVTRVP